MITGVVFDLDDTLFLQADWLEGAWASVAERAGALDGDADSLLLALRSIAAEGTAKGGIIDRALEATGQTALPVADLVRAFRDHRADHLDPLPGVVEGLRELRRHGAVGLVSDGDVPIQQNKLDALGLRGCFDAIVWSDALGRECRKPHPAPFETILRLLDLDPGEVVYVGDNPDKDIVGAAAMGMRTVRVRSGEYATRPGPEPWLDLPDIGTAMRALLLAVAGSSVG